MTGLPRIPGIGSKLAEYLLLTAVLAGFVHVVWHFLTYHYLAQPFIWDPQDTFMDWFNPAYWAHRAGIYTSWRAVYPPLSFAFLKMFSIESCYITSPFAGRDCDIAGQVTIIVLYLTAIGLAAWAFWRTDRSTALPRGLALALGLPGLFLLERGNLLIICQICLVAVAVPRMGGRWIKAIAAGAMINLKPYLLAVACSWAVKRDWRQLELAGFGTILIFLVSWAIVGSGSPIEIAENTANWVTVTGTDIVAEMFYTTSFNSIFEVIDGGFPILRYIDSSSYETTRLSVAIFMRCVQATAIAALLLAWLRPERVTMSRIALLMLLLALTSRSPGGYSEFLVVFLVFLERWRGLAIAIALIVTYLISIPYELVVSYLPNVNTADWLSGQAVTARFGIGVGQFLRPLGLLVVMLCVSLDTIVTLTRELYRERVATGVRAATS